MRLILLLMAVSWSPIVAAQVRDERLTSFQHVCSRPAALSDVAEIATADGWIAAGADQGASLARVTRSMAQMMPGLEFRVLTKRVAGRQVLLLVAEAPLPQFMVHTCTLYDLSEAGPLDIGSITGWLGAEPVRREAEGGVRYDWERPSNLPQVFSIKLGLIQPETDVADMLGYSGYSLSMEGIGPLR